MSVDEKKKKELTELQKNFISALFSKEAKGKPKVAKAMAGYADTVSVSELIHSLHEEILEYAKKYMAANAGQAVVGLFDVLGNPGQIGGSNKLKAAQEVLDRVGLNKSKDSDNTLKIPESGLVILPAKAIRIEAVVDDIDSRITEE